jgi:hypothetical protein
MRQAMLARKSDLTKSGVKKPTFWGKDPIQIVCVWVNKDNEMRQAKFVFVK